ncbi:MAG: thrombospondin type 3 repeat-containing protein, partial [Myxococcota bacterium]|nr:thrombospondin type 3 repeat-containing protein [Myxococcota bacterium]
LYLRLRLDRDPAPGGALRPFSWGLEIDLDGNLATYELLILVDGVGGGAGMVKLFTNRVTTLPNDPNDPADDPPVMMFPFAMNGRSVEAGGSDYGGDPDYFLDFAVPWTALAAVDLAEETRIYVWAASSSTSASLNGDFACHDGMTGDPDLDDIVSDPTTGDPVVDTDGDGFTDAEELEGGSDPNDPNSVPSSRLEGGGGCAVGGDGALGFALASLVAALAIRRRRGR